MAFESPQAKLPTRLSDRDLLKRITQPLQSSAVQGPNLIEANGVALLPAKGTLCRQLQNCGTVPVKYLIDNQNDCTAANFHGILAACTATDDGLGSIVDFSKVTDRVTILGVGGTPRVCSLVIFSPESHQ